MAAGNRYAIAPNGIFFSVQGEGHLRGFQMAFLRLAGCSVGCVECDTDYRPERTLTAKQIVAELDGVFPQMRDRWVWITGGEPTDWDLEPLLAAIGGRGWRTALATSGVRPVIPPVDWLSVSPHGGTLAQAYGQEIKLVDGLHGLDLERWLEDHPDSQTDFFYRYAQPLSVDGREDPESLRRCLEFIRRHPNWSLSRQDHVVWGVP
jgi:7-carboxy-7-deazaguanine synthase